MGGGFEKLRNRSNHTQKVDNISANWGHKTSCTLSAHYFGLVLAIPCLQESFAPKKKKDFGENLLCMLLLRQLDAAEL